ncbi:non-ribosomal peptide synthetase, partial [Nitrosomonas sp. JL21]|uniref:condensation domain-containing protein n=1 Tax=Nitrosomonas sp. JL21 TaxID=153949 RepID=UPI001F045451
PRQLFERQTVAALAVVMKPLEAAAMTVEDAGIPAHVPIPLLPIQCEFFEQSIPAQHHWNQAMPLKSRQRLEARWLDQALQAVVQHHRALRFSYSLDADGQWIQTAREAAAQDLLWIRSAADDEQLLVLCNDAQRSLNLQHGPLLRCLLVDRGEQGQLALLVIHHLAVDGVSWRILMEDLETAYRQVMHDEDIALPAPSSDYAVWTRRLQQYAADHADEFAYWQQLTAIPASIPCDEPSGSNHTRHYRKVTVKLDRAQTQSLLKDAPAAYRTQVNDLLLTALGGALCHWSGHTEILVDLEGHGREDLYADIDLSRTVGWFTTVFPVALVGGDDVAVRIKQTKEHLRRIPHKGIGYGLFKYHGTEEQRQILAQSPRTQVVFNYLGQFDASFDEEHLWMLADTPVGESMDPAVEQQHDLQLNSHIVGGEFHLEVGYSEARYRKETMAEFAHAFIAKLEQIIHHCGRTIRGVTPSDFPLAAMTQQELDDLPVPVEQLEDLYPLSPMQAGMLFHSVFDAGGDIYLNQLRVDIDHLDVERFRAAWQSALDRHDILRTGFIQEGRVAVQWVAKAAQLPWSVHDWRGRASLAELRQELDRLAQAEHELGMNLRTPPLLRIAVVCLDDDRYHVMMTIHHLLLDGWSTSQLMGEVLRHYGGKSLALPRYRYRDFIAWLSQRDPAQSREYWQQ